MRLPGAALRDPRPRADTRFHGGRRELPGAGATLSHVRLVRGEGASSTFTPPGAFVAGQCATLVGKDIEIESPASAAAYGVIVDGASAALGGEAQDEGVRVAGALGGVWIQNVPAALPVSVEQAIFSGSRLFGFGIGSGVEGLIVEDVKVEHTRPETVAAEGGSSVEVRVGFCWAASSQAAVHGLTLDDNEFVGMVIDGDVGAGSTLSEVTLAGGDEEEGIVLQGCTVCDWPAAGLPVAVVPSRTYSVPFPAGVRSRQ